MSTSRLASRRRPALWLWPRARTGVVLARLGVGVTGWGIAEFAEHPGAEQRSHAGWDKMISASGVPDKMLLDLP